MIIDGKELLFEEPKLGRIDTSCVIHSFDLCVKYGLWKDRMKEDMHMIGNFLVDGEKRNILHLSNLHFFIIQNLTVNHLSF
jgi:hypothetical protein